MSEKAPFECVLPDGKFARVAKIKWVDIMVSQAAGPTAMAALASRCVTLDGEVKTYQQWCECEIEDIGPIIAELTRQLAAAGNKQGVA